MVELVEDSDKHLDELEEEFKQSLEDAAEGRSSSNIDSVRERISKLR